jgi:hypothetical protein
MPPFLPLPPRSRLSRSDFAKRGSDSRQADAKQHEDLYAESAYKAARDIDAEFVNNDQNNRRAQEDLKRDETAMNTLHRGEIGSGALRRARTEGVSSGAQGLKVRRLAGGGGSLERTRL